MNLAQLPDKIEPISISTPQDVVNIFVRLVELIAALAGIISVGVLLYAGISFMVAGDSEERRKKASALLKWGLIGIIVVVLSFAAIRLTRSILSL